MMMGPCHGLVESQARLLERPTAYPGRLMAKSAITSRAVDLRKAPRRGLSHAMLVVADFKKKDFWFLVIDLSSNSLQWQIGAIILDLI